MAKNISTTFSVDMSGVVSNAITTVKAIRKSETARKEAEFQRAIANGLSYDEQIRLREKQLENEKGVALADPDFITSLEKSIGDTKKLNRFNKYRTNYATSLGDLSSGKINEEQYLGILKSQLNGVDDPELRLEIQGDIATAEAKVKTYKDTILTNQVKKAKYDGTVSTLNDAVSRVNTARAEALINDNQDEVTAYDETLSALNSQLSSVKIQDSITDFQVASSTRGTKPVEKLNYINAQVQSADPNTAIKIGDRTYTSAQQFWTLERDNFLGGNSQVFGNFFEELNTDTENNIAVATSKFGYPTQGTLDEAFNTFKDLRSKPELAPFINRLDVTQANVMSKAVDNLAKTINNVGTNNLTFQEADVQLQNIATKYGVDVSGYRLQLDEQLRNLARGGVLGEGEAAKLAPDVKVELPKINKDSTPAPSTTPTVTPTTPATQNTGSRIIKAGDTLSGIAKEAGVTLAKLIELNPQYKTNPNIIRPGQSVNLTAPTVAPTVPPVENPVVPAVTPTSTPIPINTATPTATPAPSVIPIPTPTTTPNPTETPATKPPTQTGVYDVIQGDTLSAIAAKNGKTVEELVKLNNIVDKNKIQIGQKIKLQ